MYGGLVIKVTIKYTGALAIQISNTERIGVFLFFGQVNRLAQPL